MIINQLSARTGLYFWIIPVYFGLFFLREKVVETLLDLVGNLLRILDVVSFGRFEGKTFEQYATPFREGVINSSEIPILIRILAISMMCFEAKCASSCLDPFT